MKIKQNYLIRKIFSFKLFPSSKTDFWPFLKLQKMDFGQKKFREIDLVDFTSFCLAWIFKYSGQLCVHIQAFVLSGGKIIVEYLGMFRFGFGI